MWPTPPGMWRLDPNTVHLNHGSFGAIPLPVLDEQRRWQEIVERNPTRFFWRDWPVQMDRVRAVASSFIGCRDSQLILMPNVTTAMATVMASVPLAPGDDVLVTEDAYPGVRAAVDQACRRSGASVVCAGLSPRELSPDDYQEAVLGAVTPTTKIALLDHITAMSAVLVEAASLTRSLHERGVMVAVDGAHAPGAVDLHVDEIGADYYAGNLHKWCCSPRGAAFLAHGDQAPQPLAAVVGSRAEEGLPRGLEWWGTTDYSALLAMPAALSFLESLDWATVRQGNAQLAFEGGGLVAARLGTTPPAQTGLPMSIVPLPESFADADCVQMRLDLLHHGIEVTVAAPRGRRALRLSAHVYNQVSDFGRLADTILHL